MNVLCIDVGTSGMRGILFDHTGKNLLEWKEFYEPRYLKNGWVEQILSVWEDALYRILKKITAEAGLRQWKIDVISVTSIRSSVVPVDKRMQPLCNVIMWQDRRADTLIEKMSSYNTKIATRCGATLNPVFSGIKMKWIRENMPEMNKRTYKYLVIADYILFLLTGNLCTDYTYGSRSNLMNLRTQQWDKELLELFSLEEEQLCRLIPPGSICGYTTEQLRKNTGLVTGIPVVTAGGDQQCSALGQGIVKPGLLSVTAGTGGFLITNLKKLTDFVETDIICNVSSIEGQYILEYNMLTCCSVFDWCRKEWFARESFSELEEGMQKIPAGSHGCICIPYFMGRSTPDWNKKAKGAFFNVSSRITKWDMLRSVLEGICYEFKNGIERIGQYVQMTDIFVHGGLTNSSLFNQIQADVYGEKIVRRGKTDAAARGALIVALKKMQVYETEEQAFLEIAGEDEIKEYFPEQRNVSLYTKCRDKMNTLYEHYRFLENDL